MNFDLSKKHCYYFNEICQVPHPSYHEEKIADWVRNFAKEHGFECKRDYMNNVTVYMPASKGYEDKPLLGLQAHMDMVAEKELGVQHDFLTDPIQTYVDEDGWLHAKGTTLGADDGMGVAFMLAILDSPELPHPALECMFTVQEEVGLIGALKLTTDMVKSHRVISLDGGGEYHTGISSAGGCNVHGNFKPTYIANSKKTYQFEVGGLEGGHSGGNISKEKGNATKLVFRILKEMANKGATYNLVNIIAPGKINAIPRDTRVVIASDMSLEELQKAAAKTDADLKAEFEFSDPGYFFKITEIETAPKAMDEASTKQIVNFIFLIPNGFRHKSMAIEGLTLTSLNLGFITINEDGTIKTTSSIRSALKSGISHLVEIVTALGDALGVEVTTSDPYPGWAYKEKSAMRDIMNQACMEKIGRGIEMHAGHGGCECGCFCGLYDDMDIISFGATYTGAHTPAEKLDLESFDRAYAILCRMIELA